MRQAGPATCPVIPAVYAKAIGLWACLELAALARGAAPPGPAAGSGALAQDDECRSGPEANGTDCGPNLLQRRARKQDPAAYDKDHEVEVFYRFMGEVRQPGSLPKGTVKVKTRMVDFYSAAFGFYMQETDTISALKTKVRAYAAAAFDDRFDATMPLRVEDRPGHVMEDSMTLLSHNITGDPYIVGAFTLRIFGGSKSVT